MREKTASIIQVSVPKDKQELCEPHFFKKSIFGVPEFYIQACDAYVIKEIGTDVRGIFPISFCEQPLATRFIPVLSIEKAKNQKMISFTIAGNTKNEKGEDLSNTTCSAYIMYTFENGQKLLRLPEYDEGCYFSGYDIPVLIKKQALL